MNGYEKQQIKTKDNPMTEIIAYHLDDGEGPVQPVPSLVRGSKSSTPKFDEWEIDVINDLASTASKADKEHQVIDYEIDDSAPIPEYKDQYSDLECNLDERGQRLIITCESWRGIEYTEEGNPYTPLIPERATWKAVVTTDTLSKGKPPEQWGDRWTERLSARGKRAIEDSAKYQHTLRQGYRTFLTLTFNPEWRSQIEKWDQMDRQSQNGERKTIGNLVTEFINTLQQRHRNGRTFGDHYRRAGKQQRGGGYQANGSHYRGRVQAATSSDRWTPIKRREGFRIGGSGRPFQFVWVIENPTNEYGERNPHVHILMNWHVKLDQFHAWSMWIEKTWGKGFAKLERIKKPAAAAHYMAKAANYLTKGAEGAQGLVRGNRYSVGADARAPKARLVGIYWSDMIRDVISTGMEAGREIWPRGLWFHRHGFGVNCREIWKRLMKVLKEDGVNLKPALKNLHAARFSNVAIRVLREMNNNELQANESLYREAVETGVYERVYTFDLEFYQ
ncbi:MAG: hypothetical protein AB2705_18905 [Candidatus Thiodiazotropha sp.]